MMRIDDFGIEYANGKRVNCFALVDDLTLVHGNDEDDIKIGMKEFQDFIIQLEKVIKQLKLDINIDKTG